MALNPPTIDAIISTDALKKGWRRGEGSFSDDRSIGRGSVARGGINVLELRAAYLAIQAFVKGTMNPIHIHVLVDNSTALSYIYKQARGDTFTNSGISGVRDMELLQGVTNIEADFTSRNFNDRTKWTQQDGIPENSQEVLCARSEPFCLSAPQPVTALCGEIPGPGGQ